METTRGKKKMADSHFAILMALFLANKELFRHVQPCMKTRRRQKTIFSVTRNRTRELPQFLCDFDDYAIMCLLSCVRPCV